MGPHSPSSGVCQTKGTTHLQVPQETSPQSLSLKTSEAFLVLLPALGDSSGPFPWAAGGQGLGVRIPRQRCTEAQCITAPPPGLNPEAP